MNNKRERGSTNLECAIVMVCLLVVAVVFIFGMIGAAKTTTEKLTGETNIVSRDVCETVCKIRFVDGLTDVVKFNKCMSNCAE